MKIDWRLIKRSLVSSLDEEDERVLETWLNESKKHRELYDNMKRFVSEREDFHLDEMTRKRFKRDFEARMNMAYKKRNQRLWVKVMSYAAMLVIPVIVGVLFWSRQPEIEAVDYGIGPIEHGVRKATLVLNDGKVLSLDTSRMFLKEINGVSVHTSDQALVYVDSLQDEDVQLQNRLITPKGGEYTIMLADGTKVWVNANTEIRYPVKFSGNERRVYLEGEAYFEVAKDSLRPFYVEVGDMNVKVLGTSFNISAYPNSKRQTSLVDGCVTINWNQQQVTLHPGQQATETTRELQVRQVNVSNYVGWIDRRFVFKDKRLGEILEDLERWYDVEVFVTDDKIRDLHLTANFQKYEKIDKVLEIIEYAACVKFEIKDRMIIVRLD